MAMEKRVLMELIYSNRSWNTGFEPQQVLNHWAKQIAWFQGTAFFEARSQRLCLQP